MENCVQKIYISNLMIADIGQVTGQMDKDFPNRTQNEKFNGDVSLL